MRHVPVQKTTELKTNDDAETSNSVGQKNNNKNYRKQNLEDDANNI